MSKNSSKPRPLILLTNDDGIQSPGLRAAAEALDPLGDLLIVAPYRQQSGMGRSLPHDGDHDGRLSRQMVRVNRRGVEGYAAYASPAQSVQHGIMELALRRPSLVVSGINFGENVGTGVTISGTVGAALEGAAHGIPSMAVSLQVDISLHVHYDNSVDFSAAQHFTRLLAERWLSLDPLPDVDVLKVEIPEKATPQTPLRFAPLTREDYYIPVVPERVKFEGEGPFGYKKVYERGKAEPGTDAAVLHDGFVAITPLSLDMTSRIDSDVLMGKLK